MLVNKNPYNAFQDTINNKWRKWGTAVTLPRSGHASELTQGHKQVAVRPVATLKQLKGICQVLVMCCVQQQSLGSFTRLGSEL